MRKDACASQSAVGFGSSCERVFVLFREELRELVAGDHDACMRSRGTWTRKNLEKGGGDKQLKVCQYINRKSVSIFRLFVTC
jgi:hypothetical protein